MKVYGIEFTDYSGKGTKFFKTKQLQETFAKRVERIDKRFVVDVEESLPDKMMFNVSIYPHNITSILSSKTDEYVCFEDPKHVTVCVMGNDVADAKEKAKAVANQILNVGKGLKFKNWYWIENEKVVGKSPDNGLVLPIEGVLKTTLLSFLNGDDTLEYDVLTALGGTRPNETIKVIISPFTDYISVQCSQPNNMTVNPKIEEQFIDVATKNNYTIIGQKEERQKTYFLTNNLWIQEQHTM